MPPQSFSINAYDRQPFLDSLQELIDAANPSDNITHAFLILEILNIELFASIMDYQEIDVIFNKLHIDLQRVTRNCDQVFRIADYQFGLILPKLLNKEIIHLAANKVLNTVNTQTNEEGELIHLQGYMGVKFLDEQGKNHNAYFKNLNSALYQATHNRTPFVIYDEPQQQSTESLHSLGSELQNALNTFEFSMHYQPQLDLASNHITSAEALIRWRNPKHGQVSPEQFIALSEKNNLITHLTEWVIENVFRYQAHLIRNNIPLSISINLSVRDLLSQNFTDFLKQQLETWECPAENFMLEITEGAMMANPKTALKTIYLCKELGFKLSIDDFGTGYSSLSYLKDLPVDELKIDKSFVIDVLNNPSNEQIVRSVIDLSHHFKLKVVAEGVEDKQTLDFLKATGCDIIQGYYLSKPLNEADFEAWIRQRHGSLETVKVC